MPEIQKYMFWDGELFFGGDDLNAFRIKLGLS